MNGTDGYAVFDDGSALNGRTTTGYYLRKMLDEEYTDYSKACTQPWIAIRLAEVILNHAEACYRLNADGANADLRRIRERVGLPYTDKSGEALMEAIRQERKIELYCEGHLYWDMRRWRLAHTAYTGMRVHGLKIEKQGASFVYTYVDCDRQDRLFEEKLYRIPLPETEAEQQRGRQAVPRVVITPKKEIQPMKNSIISFASAALLCLGGCHEPDEPDPLGHRTGGSTASRHNSPPGEYKNDPLAKFTATPTEGEERIVIDIPYYYPENSTNTTSITEMRVTANLDDNCFITPRLGTLDLTQENWFTLTRADGSKRDFCVTGNIKKSDKCEIISFATDEPSIQGVIDNDRNTISLISADDLSAVTAQATLSPHATISPDPAEVHDYEGEGMKFTVTAHDGVTKRIYTVSKEIPPRSSTAGVPAAKPKSGRTSPSTSSGIVNGSGKNYSLAASGSKARAFDRRGQVPVQPCDGRLSGNARHEGAQRPPAA